MARDSKAGEESAGRLDPRVVLMLQECHRHAKAIGAWGAGAEALELAGVSGSAGVVTADGGAVVVSDLRDLLAAHRVWERFGTQLS